MLKKWEVQPAPNDKNPGRHKLLIKGEMKDIFLVVKKLGGICSRPEKTGGGYDFLIYLSKFEADINAKLNSVASELGAISEMDKTPAPGSFLKAPSPAQLPDLPPLQKAPPPEVAAPPSFGQAPAPIMETPPAFQPEPRPAFAQPPVMEPPPVFSAPESIPAPQPFEQKPRPAAAPVPEPQAPAAPAPAPAPEPAPAPAPAPEAAEAPPGITQPRRNFVPSAASRAKKAEEAPAPAAPVPAAAAAPAVSASRIKAKWSMELPLIPTYNFQSLVSGSHNRFAHAAAMAVVENPGMIYNPLLVFGVPGTGKTHFVNAISNGIAASAGQGNIFVTDGVRFSKGLELAIREGGIGRLEQLFSGIKALIIDDVHLLMISEANRKIISKWLNDFVAKNKQIVVTSVFPPKALAGLEEAAGFQFTQGWMVDLKMPAPQSYKVILNQLMQGMEVKTSEDEMTQLFADKGISFGDVVSLLEGMKKLEKFVVNAANNLTHAQLLEMMMGTREPAPSLPVDSEFSEAEGWSGSDKDEWFKWGVFYPKGKKREAQFAMYRMHEQAKQLGMNTEWKQIFMQEYDPGEVFGTPFNVGNYANTQDVNGVVILGPQPSTAIFEKEGEFRHICLKILDSYSIKAAWLPMERIKSGAWHTRALMDLV